MITQNFDSIMGAFKKTITKLQKRVDALHEHNSKLQAQITDAERQHSTNKMEINQCVNAVEKLSDLIS